MKADPRVIRVTPPKPWWSGDKRVEPFMRAVSKELEAQGVVGDKKTRIYNKAYEAVYAAIKKYSGEEAP